MGAMSNSLPTIDGVVITELHQMLDDRGAVLHMLRSDAAEFVKFGECYFSEVFPGAIKAWKYHHKQTQNISVPVGRIRLVIYDVRDNVTTKGNLLAVEIGRPDDYLRIKIPPCVWYGFSCISSMPALLVNCADMPHVPEESDMIDKNSSNIPYKW